MKNEKVLEKVRKLLETTVEKGATAEESQSAVAMAQRLMAKYNLELRDVQTSEAKGSEVVTGDVAESAKLNWWEKIVSKVIANNFRCEIYISRARGGKFTLTFLGEVQDVEIARAVYKFAIAQIEHHAKQYRRKRRTEYKKQNGSTEGFDGIAIRNDFMTGYIKGLEDKFREQLESNEEMALIVQTPDSVVKAYQSMNLRTNRINTRTTGDVEARSEGYKRGKKFATPTGELK